jgi:hypothetical protein
MSENFSRKDGMQVLRAAFDDATGRLKTDATFTGVLEVALDAANDSVAIGDGTDDLVINADGSINTAISGAVSIEISAADGDSIIVSDGNDNLAINADGSINISLPAGASTSANQATAIQWLTDIEALLTEAGTQLALRMDEASATVTYVGTAYAGSLNAAASWAIKRITISGTVTTIEWADGDTNANNVWNNRAALSYS